MLVRLPPVKVAPLPTVVVPALVTLPVTASDPASTSTVPVPKFTKSVLTVVVPLVLMSPPLLLVSAPVIVRVPRALFRIPVEPFVRPVSATSALLIVVVPVFVNKPPVMDVVFARTLRAPAFELAPEKVDVPELL